MPLISTTGDLIAFSLRAAGILGLGQTSSAEDANVGLQVLVSLLAQWQRKRWLVYVEQETALAASTGAQYYTIGPGQDFDCPRPTQLKAAYFRILGGAMTNLVDMPLEVLVAREDYASISIKTLQTMPAVVWLETQWPVGRVYFWPVPPASLYGLYLTVVAPLPKYASLTDALNLPDEYTEALIWSLCVRLQMMYGLPARPDHTAAMNQALNVIRMANVQIPTLQVPIGPVRRGDVSLIGKGLGRAFLLDQGAVL